jgi:hypothetical protein
MPGNLKTDLQICQQMIKILFTGDFCPHKRIEQLILSKNFDKIYNNFLPDLENNDINITNLECPLVNEDSPIAKSGPNLIAREECIEALSYGKFNLITLSNNHIMDQGENGFFSTIDLCKKNGIDYVGAGMNLNEASRVCLKSIKGKRFAFLNYSETEFSTAETNKAGSNPLNPVKNYYDIRSSREKSDFVVVIVHGGHEEYPLPSPRMIDTYRFFIDSGADIVIGHHTHCFSGYENYNGGLIFYSLGNFIFDWDRVINSDWNYGFALKLYFENEAISFDIIPYKQCDKVPGVFLLDEVEKENFHNKLERLNKILGNEILLLKEWQTFIQRSRLSYLIKFESLNSWIYKSLRNRNILPGILTRKKKMQLLNLIRCESHRDLSIESLKH